MPDDLDRVKDFMDRGQQAQAAVDAIVPRDYDRLQTAVGLVRDAYDLLLNPETRAQLPEWTRAARRLLADQGIEIDRQDGR